MKKIATILIICLLINIISLNVVNAAAEGYPYPSLYKAYSEYFDVSVAVEYSDLTNYPELTTEQFNVLVTENAMKPWIHKGEKTWDFGSGDSIVSYAKQNNMKVRAHTLVCPPFFDAYSNNETKWFYADENGNSLFDENGNPKEGAQELTLKRLEYHIKTIITYYKKKYPGVVYAYDVVNEAYKEDGQLRTYTKFIKLLDGCDWITKCYQWAHEADPDAVLIYNDNGFTSDIKKQDVIYKKIKEIRELGIPVCVGMQMHYDVEVDLNQVENLISRFSELCDIYVTELDMGIRQSRLTGEIIQNNNGQSYAERVSGAYPDFMYDEVTELQARKYGALFDIFRKYSASIKSVGFWNICDGRTHMGTQYHPLVFDENAQPKAAFYRILDFDKRLPRWQESDKLPSVKVIDYSIDESTGTITVRGKTNSSAAVSAVVYNPDDSINVEKSFTADGDYEVELKVNTASLSEGVAPEYKLGVREGDANEVIECVTIYPVDPFESGYTMHDSLDDYSKMDSYYNIDMDSYPIFYEDDLSGIALKSKQYDESYFVYKLPEGKNADKVIVDAYVYENTLWDSRVMAKPIIWGSFDGITYTQLSDDSSWGKEIPKEKHNDNVQAKQRRHFKGTVNGITDSIKYVKIDLSQFKTNWHVYIAGVSIGIRDEKNYALHDSLDDYSKMDSYYNIGMDSYPIFYEDDLSGVALKSKEYEESYFVYKLPKSKNSFSVTVDAYVYENTLWDPSVMAKPIIWGSVDGVTYTQLSDASSWGKEIPKEKHNDNVQAKQRRHFKGMVNNISDNINYIKIDLSQFKTNWHVYIADVLIRTYGYSYTLHDSLNDRSKMYSYFNINESSNLTFYEDDLSGIGLESKQHAESYFVYKLPESKNASSITVDAYVYENTLWDSSVMAKPIIWGSVDGITYTQLSDASSWGKEIPKEKHNDNGQAKQRRHFKGTVNGITDSIKYVKIDLSQFKTNWHVYIADVLIDTRDDANYIPTEKTGVLVDDVSLCSLTAKGECPTAICHSGEFSAKTDVENRSGMKKDIMFVTVYKVNERSVSIQCSRKALEDNEKSEFTNTVTVPYGSNGKIEQFVFEMDNLLPLFDKITYNQAVGQ
jgi:endo-1,4-beta-xylanase